MAVKTAKKSTTARFKALEVVGFDLVPKFNPVLISSPRLALLGWDGAGAAWIQTGCRIALPLPSKLGVIAKEVVAGRAMGERTIGKGRR